jgi:CRP-like cAMP-binding protein
MLSSEKSSAAAVKLVDFGSAQISFDGDETFEMDDTDQAPRPAAATPAYCPPEFLEKGTKAVRIDSSFDMWGLGVILYIMLTGVHPFDLYGNATDDEIEHEIRSGHRPPTRKSPLTAHLSPHAVKLLERLLEWDPKRRMSALDLLENPWVRGETARRKKMADSDKRLAAFRTFKTKLEAKVFKDMISWTSESENGVDAVAKRTSLIERAFRVLDPDDRGYVTTKELHKIADEDAATDPGTEHKLSLSGFSDLLAENMKNRHFGKGEIIYKESEVGNHMYFINSGSVEVYTNDGSKQVRHTGDCFGEGALLHPKKIRSASVRTLTPVHAIEISREYFEKYLASDENIKLNLREKDKGRKRQRAKTILQLQQNMKVKTLSRGQTLFSKGEEGNEMYVLEEGQINLQLEGHKVSSVNPGEMTGEHSLIFGKPRNIDALCVSENCKLQTLRAKDFYRLLDSHPSLKEGIRDICYRREFMKSLCFKLNRSFPRTKKDLRDAFNAVDLSGSGVIELKDVHEMIKRFDGTYTATEIKDILNSLALHEPGKVTWAEFEHIFGDGMED